MSKLFPCQALLPPWDLYGLCLVSSRRFSTETVDSTVLAEHARRMQLSLSNANSDQLPQTSGTVEGRGKKQKPAKKTGRSQVAATTSKKNSVHMGFKLVNAPIPFPNVTKAHSASSAAKSKPQVRPDSSRCPTESMHAKAAPQHRSQKRRPQQERGSGNIAGSLSQAMLHFLTPGGKYKSAAEHSGSILTSIPEKRKLTAQTSEHTDEAHAPNPTDSCTDSEARTKRRRVGATGAPLTLQRVTNDRVENSNVHTVPNWIHWDQYDDNCPLNNDEPLANIYLRSPADSPVPRNFSESPAGPVHVNTEAISTAKPPLRNYPPIWAEVR